MKNLFKIATVLTVGALLVTGAFAQGKKPAAKTAPKKPAMHKMAKAMNCPACNMPLSAKKDKMHTVAVKVNGKTMYCCSNPACKMPPNMLAKTMGKKKGHMKSHGKGKAMGKKK